MAQTDYGYKIPYGLPGGIYDLSDKKIVTRTLDSDVTVKPGMGVVVGETGGETVAAPASTSTADNFEGVFVHGSKQMEHDTDGNVETSGQEAIGVMQQGKIWVLISDTATTDYGTTVALIADGDNVGKFTSSDDTTETSIVALTDAVFIGKADTENSIAVIELK